MGGLQIRSCDNCANVFTISCSSCSKDLSNWQSKRGAKKGVKPKPGAATPGPKQFKDRGELRQDVRLYFKTNDITKAGGYKKVKEYLESIFYKLIKGL